MSSKDWIEKRSLEGLTYYYNAKNDEIRWDKPSQMKTQAEIRETNDFWTWVPHPKFAWQPARKVGTNANGTEFKTEKNESIVIANDGTYEGPMSNNKKVKVPIWPLLRSSLERLEDDLVMLRDVNEGMISYTLRERYSKDQIYTWVGASHNVLVSVNPFKELDLYSDNMINMYHKNPPNVVLGPHPFAIARDAYNAILGNEANQTILISGESGAGKTEATKQCLSYIARVSGTSSAHVEEKLLASNPLLEAFGNARTIRNNNSSRFGKWVEVYINMNEDGITRSISGAKINNYLLEKSRVVHQQQGERNFHIFYQMLHNSAMSEKFGLQGGVGGFVYTKATDNSGASDARESSKDFEETLRAMDLLGFTEETRDWVLGTVAAILHLGNIQFQDKEEAGSVAGSKTAEGIFLEHAAKYLGVSKESLETALCYRSITVRSETSVIPLNPSKAEDARDALAKALYGKMFDFLVAKANDTLSSKGGPYIGLLDIFGFEIFENNSFEQLCINFANEKLQQQFNRTTFKDEEELYIVQEIKYKHIEFVDNQNVLDLIEKRPMGILLMLDEEGRVPQGSNEKFMNKVASQHASHPKFATDKHRKMVNKLSFEIEHYAGVVQYDCTNFMEKNKDTLFADMQALLSTSAHQCLSSLFPKDSANTQTKTLSTQFRGQLNDLMQSLVQTESKYIRCIKPNKRQVGNSFDTVLVLEQLRYAGVFEAVEIRKQGYPFRLTYPQFVCRYKCINKHKYKADRRDDQETSKEIISASPQKYTNIQFGKSMVLYRAEEHATLQLLRSVALDRIIPKCQAVMRGRLHRRFAVGLKHATQYLDYALKEGNDLDLLTDAIERVDDTIGPLVKFFSFKPVNLSRAILLKKQVQRWQELEATLDRITEVETPNKTDLKSLEDTLAEAETLKHVKLTPRQTKLLEIAKSHRMYMEIKLQETHITENLAQFSAMEKFSNMRTPKDFASKAFVFGRGKFVKGMLLWSSAPLPRSLLKLDKGEEATAKANFIALQSFMGDKKCKDPNEEGMRFLNNGLKTPAIRDEMYCQIIKQCNENPSEASVKKAHEIFSICLSMFLPSASLENFVLAFMRRTPFPEQLKTIFLQVKYEKKAPPVVDASKLDSVSSANLSTAARCKFTQLPSKLELERL